MKKNIVYLAIVVVILIGLGSVMLTGNNHSSEAIIHALTGSPTITSDSNTNKLVFHNYGPAPEFKNIDSWYNSEARTITSLKGKVVLINFWTYSCITCIRMLPRLNQWYVAYKDQGLVVIGIHTPRYAFERVSDGVRNAIQRYNVRYPVAQDNSYTMWNSYDNQFWPASYLIDKDGKIVYQHVGDGSYDLIENAIQQLVTLPGGLSVAEDPNSPLNQPTEQTIQLGLKHADAMASNEKPTNQEQVYTFPDQLRRNLFALEGIWKLGDDKADLTQNYGRIELSFNATVVKLTAQSIKPVTLKIFVDGKPQPDVTVRAANDYQLYAATEAGRHIMEIDIPQPGFEASAFILSQPTKKVLGH